MLVLITIISFFLEYCVGSKRSKIPTIIHFDVKNVKISQSNAQSRIKTALAEAQAGLNVVNAFSSELSVLMWKNIVHRYTFEDKKQFGIDFLTPSKFLKAEAERIKVLVDFYLVKLEVKNAALIVTVAADEQKAWKKYLKTQFMISNSGLSSNESISSLSSTRSSGSLSDEETLSKNISAELRRDTAAVDFRLLKAGTTSRKRIIRSRARGIAMMYPKDVFDDPEYDDEFLFGLTLEYNASFEKLATKLSSIRNNLQTAIYFCTKLFSGGIVLEQTVREIFTEIRRLEDVRFQTATFLISSLGFMEEQVDAIKKSA